MGKSCLASTTTGSENAAVGESAGGAATTGGGHSLLGYQAGVGLTTGTLCTFVGHNAGQDATTGSYNTFIGTGTIAGTGNFGAGHLVTTGAKNVILGGFNGNQNSFDIRALDNNVVLSDGDGTPILWEDLLEPIFIAL